MKSFLGGVAGAVAVAALILVMQTGAFTSNGLAPAQSALPNLAAAPLVDCGPGRQAVTRPVVVAQQVVPQVECVALVAPAAPTVVRPVTRSRAVQPTYTRYAPDRVVDSFDEPRETVVKQPRSWKKSALIIGGSAAGGAGIGAIFDGGKGAKKGAVIGGVAGVVYDIATRNK